MQPKHNKTIQKQASYIFLWSNTCFSMLEAEACRRQDNTQVLTFVSPRNDIDYLQRLEKHDTRRWRMAPQYRIICGGQLSPP